LPILHSLPVERLLGLEADQQVRNYGPRLRQEIVDILWCWFFAEAFLQQRPQFVQEGIELSRFDALRGEGGHRGMELVTHSYEDIADFDFTYL